MDNIEPDFDLMERCWNDHEKMGIALTALLCGALVRPGMSDKANHEKALQQGAELVADVLASRIAMQYLAEKNKALLEGENKSHMQVHLASVQALIVHQKLRGILPGFFLMQMERARNRQEGNGPDNPRFN